VKKDDRFALYEEIALLAFHEEKGTVRSGVMFPQAVSASLLADLLLDGRLIIDDGRRKLVSAAGSSRTGDPLLDEALRRIRTAKRRASLKTWVTRLAGTKRLKARVAEQLCRRGILRADQRSLLLVFSRTVYPEVLAGPERRLVARLRKAIFADGRQLDPRTVVLVSLADGTGLLKAVFGRRAMKDRKARIRQIAAGEVVGKAAREAVEAMQAAVAVAVIIPAITTATSVH